MGFHYTQFFPSLERYSLVYEIFLKSSLSEIEDHTYYTRK